MLSCRQVTQMLSSDQELSWSLQWQLRVHLLMCRNCSNFAKQLRLMKHYYRDLFRQKTRLDPHDLKDLEKRVIERVTK